ncbi:MAG: helix-turn-helix domain-containing protein [Oscillospiraceae bacterium]|jgi:transcriptional regulator with XRE-family HTH domain|nr:helix-turn-helix domain-containing protein [Oscillospiraceae bacterium]
MLNISENIRKLRLAKDVTQEKIADALGVTAKAVSKWECGDAYPDIALLIPLAAYFDVSVDKLIGMDEEMRTRKLYAAFDEISALRESGDASGAIARCRSALRDFPHERSLELQLADMLAGLAFEDGRPTDDTVTTASLREAVEIVGKLADSGGTDWIFRAAAQDRLPLYLSKLGDDDAARAAAMNIENGDGRMKRLACVTRGEERMQLVKSMLGGHIMAVRQVLGAFAPQGDEPVGYAVDPEVSGLTADGIAKLVAVGDALAESLADFVGRESLGL